MASRNGYSEILFFLTKSIQIDVSYIELNYKTGLNERPDRY